MTTTNTSGNLPYPEAFLHQKSKNEVEKIVNEAEKHYLCGIKYDCNARI